MKLHQIDISDANRLDRAFDDRALEALLDKGWQIVLNQTVAVPSAGGPERVVMLLLLHLPQEAAALAERGWDWRVVAHEALSTALGHVPVVLLVAIAAWMGWFS